MDASIIIETYNYSEDPDLQLLRDTVRGAVAIQRENPLRCEVLLADLCGTPEILALFKEFPEVRRIDIGMVPYDAAKHLIPKVASTDKEEVMLKGGHVSLVAGPNAIKRLWPKLDSWLGERST